MKFSLVHPALALGVALTLAACGGGKATYPITVTVANVQYSGLVLSTNGQDVAVPPGALKADGTYADSTVVFPNQIEYGVEYSVYPKNLGSTTQPNGAQPLHQTCQPGSTDPLLVYNQPAGTAGRLASIDVRYTCSIKTFPVGGTIKGLTGTGLVLTNGSTGAGFAATPSTVAGADIKYVLVSGSTGGAYGVAYKATYGVTVLAQPTGQTCTVANPTGTITDAVEAVGEVNNVNVICVNN
jgi:hypothetical protein